MYFGAVINGLKPRIGIVDLHGMTVAVQRPALFQDKIALLPRRQRDVLGQIAVRRRPVDELVKLLLVFDLRRARRGLVGREGVAVIERERRRALAARDLFGRERVLRARIENRRKDARKRHRQNGDRRDQFCPCRRMCHNFPFPFPFMFRRSRPMSSSLRPRAP